MKIAIHHCLGSFSDKWIEYCKNKGIEYKIVNAYDSDIVKQVEDCDAFMWHHYQMIYKDKLFAKQLLYSLEIAGKRVYPDFNTTWHFDDKVGQKYLLEAIGAPFVPSYVFYDKKTATQWANNTSYPKVFKLTGGAGASNVSLVRNKKEARKKINKSFGRGFSQQNKIGGLKERYRKWRTGKESFTTVVKGIGRLIIPTEFAKMFAREKGYAYFQEFIPNNDHDIRVIIVNNKAFAIKRYVRKNDFRASGSGNISYNQNEIDVRCLEISFKVNNILKTQSIAFDFIFDKDNNPLIIEISYGFASKAYKACPGYWDDKLIWHEGEFSAEEWMVEDLLM